MKAETKNSASESTKNNSQTSYIPESKTMTLSILDCHLEITKIQALQYKTDKRTDINDNEKCVIQASLIVQFNKWAHRIQDLEKEMQA